MGTPARCLDWVLWHGALSASVRFYGASTKCSDWHPMEPRLSAPIGSYGRLA